jgi:hypothetical protein
VGGVGRDLITLVDDPIRSGQVQSTPTIYHTFSPNESDLRTILVPNLPRFDHVKEIALVTSIVIGMHWGINRWDILHGQKMENDLANARRFGSCIICIIYHVFHVLSSDRSLSYGYSNGAP